jgi:hypothetical protein
MLETLENGLAIAKTMPWEVISFSLITKMNNKNFLKN